MNLLIAGASGFIGRQLIDAIKNEHQITVLGRQDSLLKSIFPTTVAYTTWDKLDSLDALQFDAVMNLSGHNIAASRWNSGIKQDIIQSRVNTTKTLIEWVIKQQAKPHIYCANAIGIYGVQQNDDKTIFDEDSLIDYQLPKDYLSEIGILWEQALDAAKKADLPVTITRFGVVLKKSEGMLGKLYPSFYLGLGSIMGDGQQSLSWIHYADVVSALKFLLNNPKLTGSFNLTSPNPISQEKFARTLAKTLHRPLLLKMPAFVIRALLGEMGETLILKGQRVVPKRLLESGFQFKFPHIENALAQEFGDKP